MNKGLKKFASINKRAADQYVAFSEQREELKARVEEVERGRASIEELIQTLDDKKDEAIQRTLKQARDGGGDRSHFESHLAPRGHTLVPLSPPLSHRCRSTSRSASSR